MSEYVKLEPKITLGSKDIDLNEPDYDGSINLQPLPKKVPEETKRAPKPKNTIALF